MLLLLRANQRQTHTSVICMSCGAAGTRVIPVVRQLSRQSKWLLTTRSLVRAQDESPVYNCNNISSHNPTCKIQGQWRSGITPLYASMAQLAAQLTCNQQVKSSTLFRSSTQFMVHLLSQGGRESSQNNATALKFDEFWEFEYNIIRKMRVFRALF